MKEGRVWVGCFVHDCTVCVCEFSLKWAFLGADFFLAGGCSPLPTPHLFSSPFLSQAPHEGWELGSSSCPGRTNTLNCPKVFAWSSPCSGSHGKPRDALGAAASTRQPRADPARETPGESLGTAGQAASSGRAGTIRAQTGMNYSANCLLTLVRNKRERRRKCS